jgi:hypothetical protein
VLVAGDLEQVGVEEVDGVPGAVREFGDAPLADGHGVEHRGEGRTELVAHVAGALCRNEDRE